MLPTKNVILVYLSVCMNRKCKLVTTTIRAEKQKMVKWHIQSFEPIICAKRLILLLNL